MNSLFLGAQQFGLVDKSMRWQTDILVKCKDAFRLYGSSGGLERGACIFADLYDNSGQWTGEGKFINHEGEVSAQDADDSIEIPGRVIWGAYDTYYQQDIFESLKRVDMKLGAYEVGDPSARPDYSEILERALPVLNDIANGTNKKISTPRLFDMIGEATDKEKNWLGQMLSKAGAGNNGNRDGRDFTKFSLNKFMRLTGQ